ncbi:uncharacterized protein LOC143180168 [Calliopsis andreniformis]|uniref:uncharacterized protein LOC143180168 n=1 Tax=Calliopsis andreniformis TaxID=337506 RepID=UPI003FCE6C19
MNTPNHLPHELTLQQELVNNASILQPDACEIMSLVQDGIYFKCSYLKLYKYVRILDGPRLQIRISYSETIGYLKQRLAKLLDERHRKWQPDRMRLWVDGHYLEDNRTLSDYNLTSEDRIMLLLDNHFII